MADGCAAGVTKCNAVSEIYLRRAYAVRMCCFIVENRTREEDIKQHKRGRTRGTRQPPIEFFDGY